MTRWCTYWIEHSSLTPAAQCMIIKLAEHVFDILDWGALRLKQLLAAEVMRSESESQDESVRWCVSRVLDLFPEIRQL